MQSGHMPTTYSAVGPVGRHFRQADSYSLLAESPPSLEDRNPDDDYGCVIPEGCGPWPPPNSASLGVDLQAFMTWLGTPDVGNRT